MAGPWAMAMDADSPPPPREHDARRSPPPPTPERALRSSKPPPPPPPPPPHARVLRNAIAAARRLDPGGFPSAEECGCQGPPDWHPAFCGCWDWHSAVHAHWSIAECCLERSSRPTTKGAEAGAKGDDDVARREVLPDYDELTEAGLAVLRKHIAPENVAAEVRSLEREDERARLSGRGGAWEVPYGHSWVLALASALRRGAASGGTNAREFEECARALRPLEVAACGRLERWVDGLLQAPVGSDVVDRSGSHGNAAFALRRIVAYLSEERAASDGGGPEGRELVLPWRKVMGVVEKHYVRRWKEALERKCAAESTNESVEAGKSGATGKFSLLEWASSSVGTRPFLCPTFAELLLLDECSRCARDASSRAGTTELESLARAAKGTVAAELLAQFRASSAAASSRRPVPDGAAPAPPRLDPLVRDVRAYSERPRGVPLGDVHVLGHACSRAEGLYFLWGSLGGSAGEEATEGSGVDPSSALRGADAALRQEGDCPFVRKADVLLEAVAEVVGAGNWMVDHWVGTFLLLAWKARGT